jgi:protein translocase SecG subunit
MKNILEIFQIIFAILLMIAILLQQRGSGLGVAFGGEGNVYRSRRGVESFLFYSTILIAFLFCLTAVLTVFIG